MEQPITVYNVDGTKNKTGMITCYVDLNLQIGDKITDTRLMVTGLGKQKIILGFPLFKEMNLEINWEKGTHNWTKEERTLSEDTVRGHYIGIHIRLLTPS